MLGRLPRLARLGSGKLVAELCQVAMGCGGLLIDQFEAGGHNADVSRCRLHRAVRHPKRLPSQDLQDCGSIQPTDTMRCEHTIDSALAKPDCLRWRRRPPPQLEKRFVAKIVHERKHLWAITPELLATDSREPLASLL